MGRMYEILRYSVHRITILLAKYKSLNYFILEKTFFFLESVSELIGRLGCFSHCILVLNHHAEEFWLTVLHCILSNYYPEIQTDFERKSVKIFKLQFSGQYEMFLLHFYQYFLFSKELIAIAFYDEQCVLSDDC